MSGLGELLQDGRDGIDFEDLPVDQWTLDECWVWLAAQGAITCESSLDDVVTARALVHIVMDEAE